MAWSSVAPSESDKPSTPHEAAREDVRPEARFGPGLAGEAFRSGDGEDAPQAAADKTRLREFRAGEVLTLPHEAGEAWELQSGWVGLFDAVQGVERSVAIALPGEILSCAGLSGVGATHAMCLGDVTATALATPTAFFDPRDEAQRGGTGRRRMPGPVRTAGLERHVPRRRVANLLCAVLERRRGTGQEGLTLLLPVVPERLAVGIGVSLESLLGALSRLIEARVLCCALETPKGVVVRVIDAGALRLLSD